MSIQVLPLHHVTGTLQRVQVLGVFMTQEKLKLQIKKITMSKDSIFCCIEVSTLEFWFQAQLLY